MYRAAALAAQRHFGRRLPGEEQLGAFCRSLDLHFSNETDPPRLFLGDEDVSTAIRTPEMDILSSNLSAVPEVRRAMVSLQRGIAATADLVAEGRDMGTVVFPQAPHKFFLTASPETRARRRWQERLDRGEDAVFETVLIELKQRDRQDENRPVAPLRPAPDARLIDTDGMEIDAVLEALLKIIKNY